LIERSTDRKNTVVVSDDREISLFARHCGVKAMSVEEFIRPPRSQAGRGQDSAAGEAKQGLNYTQQARINEELKKLWLK